MIGVAVVGLLFAPTSVSTIGPGPAFDVRDVIAAGGTRHHDGGLLMLTVEVRRARVLEGIRCQFDDAQRNLGPRSADPHGLKGKRARALARMQRSIDNARVAVSSHVGRQRPARLDIDLGEIGGGSGGLMLALGIVDRLGETDLTAGRVIAGTGTLRGDGRVGRVGGLEFKVAAAERSAAAIFLVPAEQAVEARRLTRTMQVVGVATLTDAVRVLA